MPESGVVIVGASAAGLAVAQRLRARDYRAPVTLLGAENHLPYDRPPLSKQVLAGTSTPDSTKLVDPDELARLDVDLMLGCSAIDLDVERRTVSTLVGDWSAEHVVLATGATPRTLPGADGLAGVHVHHRRRHPPARRPFDEYQSGHRR
jgi:NADPH-dependent 2,4-dienoyl-CoA reductase/sulfur reductase-like enzyme